MAAEPVANRAFVDHAIPGKNVVRLATNHKKIAGKNPQFH